MPFRLIGKTVEVQARNGVVYIRHRGTLIAEHAQRLGRHELAIQPEHGPGAIARNARSRFASSPLGRTDPLAIEVEVRDLALYERLGGLAGAQP